jgi:hypothetical protein
MKQIERPDVECASRKINAGRGLGFDDHECSLYGFGVSSVETAQFAGIDRQAQEEMTLRRTN